MTPTGSAAHAAHEVDDAGTATASAHTVVLSTRDLSVDLRVRGETHRVVDAVDLEIRAGELMALVGESGSGKSMTAKAVARLLPKAAKVASGAVHLAGDDLLALSDRAMDQVRGRRVGFVFQNHMASLDPTMSVRRHFRLTLRDYASSARQADDAARNLLDSVGIPDPPRVMGLLPHELSGGMGQRVLIALAVSGRPEVLIADEPTTALDVTVQRQVLRLLRTMAVERGMGVLFITHDLGVAAQVCDSVSVMYAGRIVESGPAATVFRSPAMPYTTGLLDALPHVVSDDEERWLPFVPGDPPPLGGVGPGCQFAPRCAHVRDVCQDAEPFLTARAGHGRHVARCHGTEAEGWIS